MTTSSLSANSTTSGGLGGSGKRIKGRGEGGGEDYSKKLQEINQKLAEVVAERKKLSPIKPRPHTKSSKTENGATEGEQGQDRPKKKSQKKYHHPNVNVLLTEISLSPYLTNPEKNYSKKTIQLPTLIRDLRDREHSSASESSISSGPINDKELVQLKRTFHEVMHYKQQYTSQQHQHQHQPLSRTSLSSLSSPSSNLPLRHPPPLPSTSKRLPQTSASSGSNGIGMKQKLPAITTPSNDLHEEKSESVQQSQDQSQDQGQLQDEQKEEPLSS